MQNIKYHQHTFSGFSYLQVYLKDSEKQLIIKKKKKKKKNFSARKLWCKVLLYVPDVLSNVQFLRENEHLLLHKK